MNTLSKKELRKLAFINPRAGSNITNVIAKMVDRANTYDIRVTCVFNNVQFVIEPGMTSEEGYQLWSAEMQRRGDKYSRSMKAAVSLRKQIASAKANNARGVEVRTMLSEEKIQVPLFKRFSFNKAVRINSDPYGASSVNYAIAWAVAMQRAMRSGKALEDVAQELSHSVNYDSITGFQHGAARSFLISFWKHGKKLEAWHQSQ
jgi:hypothetical protein